LISATVLVPRNCGDKLDILSAFIHDNDDADTASRIRTLTALLVCV